MSYKVGDIVYIQYNVDVERSRKNMPLLSSMYDKSIFKSILRIHDIQANDNVRLTGYPPYDKTAIESFLIPITAISYKKDTPLNNLIRKLSYV